MERSADEKHVLVRSGPSCLIQKSSRIGHVRDVVPLCQELVGIKFDSCRVSSIRPKGGSRQGYRDAPFHLGTDLLDRCSTLLASRVWCQFARHKGMTAHPLVSRAWWSSSAIKFVPLHFRTALGPTCKLLECCHPKRHESSLNLDTSQPMRYNTCSPRVAERTTQLN